MVVRFAVWRITHLWVRAESVSVIPAQKESALSKEVVIFTKFIDNSGIITTEDMKKFKEEIDKMKKE